jgi:hypothetical protein
VFRDHKSLRPIDHRCDTKVNFGTQPAVETKFLLAEMVAFLKCRKIQETEIDRFLDLVDKISGQKDDRDVGLDNLDTVSRVRVGLRSR